MVAEDYELVSKKELQVLRDEIRELKAHPGPSLESSVTLIEAMDRLASQMAHLVRLFEHANKELYDEYGQGFHAEAAKLDALIKQNEKIAKGVLAVADLVQRSGSSPSAPRPAEPTPASPTQGAYPLGATVPASENEHQRKRMLREFR